MLWIGTDQGDIINVVVNEKRDLFSCCYEKVRGGRVLSPLSKSKRGCNWLVGMGSQGLIQLILPKKL